MALDSETLDQLLLSVERYVRERLVPAEQDVADNDEIPEPIVKEMKEMGLFGLSIPEPYGGLGLTMAEEVEVALRLGRTSPAFRSLIGTNNGIGSQGVIMDGTEAQKQRWLPGLASGDERASFCLTEPGAGSDAGAIATKAARDGDDFVISGTKCYITNGPRATLFTLIARTDHQSKGPRGLTAFMVDAQSDGITLGPPEKKMGQQGSHVGDVTFDEVRVPAENIIGGDAMLGQGFKTAMKVLDRGRLHISAVCVGLARRLIAESLNHATTREQFGEPLSNFQLVQAMLADSEAECFAGEAMVRAAAREYDSAGPSTLRSSSAKLFCTEMVGRVADRAVQIHGGSGYIASTAVERFYRDVRLFRLYEGTSEIQKLIIGRELVKQFRQAH